MKLDKQQLKVAREIIQKKLNEACKELGYDSIELGSISYDNTSFRSRVVAQANPASEDPTVKNFLKLHDLPEDVIGKRIRVQGSMFTVKGVKLSRPKYPFHVEGAQGGQYKMTVDQVKNGLKTIA